MAESLLNTALLRERIQEKYGTQSEFARRCGWSRQYVSRVLRGEATISLRRALVLADMLDTPVDTILTSPQAEPVVAETTRTIREAAAEYASTQARDGDFAPPDHFDPWWDSVDEARDAAIRSRTTKGWPRPQLSLTRRQRWQMIRELRGAYRDLLPSTEEFMRRKQKEIDLEDRQYAPGT